MLFHTTPNMLFHTNPNMLFHTTPNMSRRVPFAGTTAVLLLSSSHEMAPHGLLFLFVVHRRLDLGELRRAALEVGVLQHVGGGVESAIVLLE